MRTKITQTTLDALAAAADEDPKKLAVLADLAMWGRLSESAYALARRACALAPADREIAAMTRRPLAGNVPGWHVLMVRETARNDAYERAIRRAVRPGMRVLDIGAGTGLLAMMAARAGAAAVFTCESNPAIADAATEIIALNGYADRVSVLAKHSTAIDPVADLGGPVDLLISEVLASDLLGEGVLPTVVDAAARLLKPGGAMIPAGGEIRVALAHWSESDAGLLDRASGFDLRPFNRLARMPARLGIADPHLQLKSTARSLFSFDFRHAESYTGGSASVRLEAEGEGANGYAQWIRCTLDDATVYENQPGAARRSAWFVSFTALDRALAVGETLDIHGRHGETSVWTWAGPSPADATG